MEKDDSLREVQKIYADVSDWLKFVEAKHAGLFAVWVAVLGVVVNIDELTNTWIKLKLVLIIIICIGIIIELFSFFPFLNQLKFLRQLCYQKYCKFKGNAVFYQSIFVDTFSEDDMDISIDKYIKILQQRGIQTDGKLITDYIRQIVEVASVGTIKIYLFNIAAKYTFMVIFVTIFALIIA